MAPAHRSPLPVSVPRDRVLEAIRRRDPFLIGSLVAQRSTWHPRLGVIRVSLDFDIADYMQRAAAPRGGT